MIRYYVTRRKGVFTLSLNANLYDKFYHVLCCSLGENIMERSLDSLAGMATSAFGAGTSAAMRQATSPKTILEYIINFLPVVGCVGKMKHNIRN